jgi:copper resistance protein B
MNTNPRITSIVIRRSMRAAALLLAVPLVASAQDDRASTGAPKTAMQDMPGMDHSSMQGMTMPPASDTASLPAGKYKKKHAAPKHPADAKTAGDMPGMDHASMPGMDHKEAPKKSDAMQGMDHGSMRGMDPGSMQGVDSMSGMTMGPMQGGSPPPNARSPDYSDGIVYGPMKGMDTTDKAPLGMLLIDQLEYTNGNDANGLSWEAEGWYGNDSNKLWVRTERDRSGGKIEDADVEAFWNRNIATFWSTQAGVRHDFGEGPSRTWAAFGVQGLAPYWFELEATGYVDASGRTAARLRAEYELLLTQRLILQPEAEINLYGKDDPATRIGSGVSDVQFGLRLRYEIRRQSAPYIGVNWVRRIGTTADYARQDRQPVLDRQIVVGVRIWL